MPKGLCVHPLGGNCTLRTHTPQTVPLHTKSAVTAAAAVISLLFVFRWSNLNAQPDETIVGNRICKRAYCWLAETTAVHSSMQILHKKASMACRHCWLLTRTMSAPELNLKTLKVCDEHNQVYSTWHHAAHMPTPNCYSTF